MPTLDQFIDHGALTALIERARDEDLGPSGRDVTSQVMEPTGHPVHAEIRSRHNGVLAGGVLLAKVIEVFEATVSLSLLVEDGKPLNSGSVIAQLSGQLQAILKLERTALNLISHLSGISTLTARFVEAVKGTNAVICDTRKTIVGLRSLSKYAVACGGGVNHRLGLFDAVLIKDNHIAGTPLENLTQVLTRAITKARAVQPPPAFVEVEVDTLSQLQRVLPCAADIILLDNMPLHQLQEAVAIRNAEAPQVLLESSGGVTLEDVCDIAQTGVDRIAIGQITHSAMALDVGLDLV